MYYYIDIMKLADRRKKQPKCVRSLKDYSHLWCHLTISVVIQSLCCFSCPTLLTPWTAAPLASLSFTISQSLLKLMSIESVMPSNHLILCCPLSSCLQSFPATGSFLMSWLFTSGSHSIGASASVLPMTVQG